MPGADCKHGLTCQGLSCRYQVCPYIPAAVRWGGMCPGSYIYWGCAIVRSNSQGSGLSARRVGPRVRPCPQAWQHALLPAEPLIGLLEGTPDRLPLQTHMHAGLWALCDLTQLPPVGHQDFGLCLSTPGRKSPVYQIKWPLVTSRAWCCEGSGCPLALGLTPPYPGLCGGSACAKQCRPFHCLFPTLQDAAGAVTGVPLLASQSP